MTFAALALAAGVVLLQQQAELPSLAWAWTLVPLLAFRFAQPTLRPSKTSAPPESSGDEILQHSPVPTPG